MWGIIKSNIRNNITGNIVVLLFLVLAVTLMFVGTSVAISTPNLFDEKDASLSEADALMQLIVRTEDQKIIDNALLTLIAEVFTTSSSLISDYDIREIYYTQLYNKMAFNTEFSYYQIAHELISPDDKFPVTIVDEELRDEGYPVYIGRYFDVKGLVDVGDEIILSKVDPAVATAEDMMTFYVAGYVDTIRDVYNNGRFYYPETSYNALLAYTDDMAPEFKHTQNIIHIDYHQSSTLTVNQHLQEIMAISKIIEALGGIIEEDGVYLNTNFGHVEAHRANAEMIISILGAVMIVFALVVSLIAIIIIRFLVVSNIEDNIKGIGVLKANGYLTRDLKKCYLLQYLIITAVAILIGAIIAIFTINHFAGIITMACNIVFSIPLNAGLCVASVAIILGFAMAVVYMTSSRLGKIHPIMALRKGVATHSFKRNYVRLDKVKCGNNTAIALKSILNNRRQSVLILVIVIITSLITTFTSVLYYNMNVNLTAMYPILGEETSDYVYAPDRSQPDETVVLESDMLDRYNTILRPSGNYYIYEGVGYTMRGVDDYSKLNIDQSYEGRMPIHDNEIAISTLFHEDTGATIGDYITLTLNEVEREVIVTGYTQGINSAYQISYTLDGIKQFYDDPDDIQIAHQLYLKEGITHEQFTAYILDLADKDEFYGHISDTQDIIENNHLATFADASTALMTVMIVITALIILMQLIMMIKIKLSREKNGIAINKALGYRSRDIIAQITMSMSLIIMLGCIIGVIMGALLASPLMQLALTGYGIMNIMFAINWWYCLAIAIGIPILSIVLTILVALPVSGISPARLKSS